MAAKAGWYADPANPGEERFWNGERWADQRRSARGPSAAASAAAGAAVSKLALCITVGTLLYIAGAIYAASSYSKIWDFSLDASESPDSSEILRGVLIGSGAASVGAALLIVGLIGFGVKLGREAARV